MAFNKLPSVSKAAENAGDCINQYSMTSSYRRECVVTLLLEWPVSPVSGIMKCSKRFIIFTQLDHLTHISVRRGTTSHVTHVVLNVVHTQKWKVFTVQLEIKSRYSGKLLRLYNKSVPWSETVQIIIVHHHEITTQQIMYTVWVKLPHLKCIIMIIKIKVWLWIDNDWNRGSRRIFKIEFPDCLWLLLRAKGDA